MDLVHLGAGVQKIHHPSSAAAHILLKIIATTKLTDYFSFTALITKHQSSDVNKSVKQITLAAITPEIVVLDDQKALFMSSI